MSGAIDKDREIAESMIEARQQARWARESAARERRDAVRKPPRPPYEGIGLCPMCGRSAVEAKHPRRVWHPECAQVWRIVAGSTGDALIQLRRERGQRCESCCIEGEHQFLEVDHRTPLWSLAEKQRAQIRWWMPWNLQLLCRDCHLEKSARESAERAHLRNAS